MHTTKIIIDRWSMFIVTSGVIDEAEFDDIFSYSENLYFELFSPPKTSQIYIKMKDLLLHT